MKLYEFTLTDNLNLPESAVLENAKAFLEDEARLQGWKPGYKFEQCKKVERLSSGELRYSFAVNGEPVEETGTETSSTEGNVAQGSNGIAARRPDAEL